jgi:hypothetical protein
MPVSALVESVDQPEGARSRPRVSAAQAPAVRPRPSRSRRLLAALGVALGVLGLAPAVQAQSSTPTEKFWTTDASSVVSSMALSGTTLYIGGTFNYVGPRKPVTSWPSTPRRLNGT